MATGFTSGEEDEPLGSENSVPKVTDTDEVYRILMEVNYYYNGMKRG